jgi:hypothetical protein
MKIISIISRGGKFSAPLGLLALVLLGGFSARAQSNSIPGDTDYDKFSAFISARNIFDPARYPHYTPHHTARIQHHSNSAPTFTLVGTMSYEKGNFAFFSGNTDDLKKILPVAGSIVGYIVTEITPAGVKMAGADKKEIRLKIGDRMQQGNSGWQLLAAGDDAAGSGIGLSAPTGSDGSAPTATPDPTSAAPAPNLGNNSVLERLRKLKEQENK